MRYKHYDRLLALFITVLLVSNIASSAKIIDWGISIAGIPLAFDAGTLLFPISYIFGDVLTEVYGFRTGRRVIWNGFACAALMSALIWLVGRLPGEAFWQQNVGQDAYQAVLGGVGSGAIVVASLAAYWAGSFSNAMILARMKVLTDGRWLWSRTVGSTLVGEAIDTLVFISLATALGVPGFVPQIWLTLVLTNYLFKVAVEVCFTPLTYVVVNALKRAEGEDYFDRQTDFNPFHLG